MGQDSEIERLRQENVMLRRAVSLLHNVATLVRAPLEVEPTCYAILTGVTAGVGLGLNRAMLFFVDEQQHGQLRGVAAVGPRDQDEADRVWRSIAADAVDLHTLYERGLQQRERPGPLDSRVRQTVVPVDGDSPVALALRSHEVVRRQGSDDLGGLLHLPTAVAAPLRGPTSLAGVLYGDNRFTGRRLDPDAELVFALLADHAARAIESARAYERVARAARTDSLTGLGHHGAMRAALDRAIARAHGAGAPLGLAMIDLDDFKQVNDRLGHLAGDAVLVAVADRLRVSLRPDATAFRYGGEELAVLLPGVRPEELARVGERLRAAVGDHPYPVGADRLLPVTCSVGLASLCAGDGAEALISRADQALLLAKRRGKNRVESG